MVFFIEAVLCVLRAAVAAAAAAVNLGPAIMAVMALIKASQLTAIVILKHSLSLRGLVRTRGIGLIRRFNVRMRDK